MSRTDAHGVVHSIQISNGGVPKHAVEAARVTAEGVEGDWQAQRKYHGGPERAVSLFSLDVIERLRAEGHPIAPGTTGENLTIAGLDWKCLEPGSTLTIGGGVVLQLTAPAVPCRTIGRSFLDGDSRRISAELYPGDTRWYARVVREGDVKRGDAVVVVGAAPQSSRD